MRVSGSQKSDFISTFLTSLKDQESQEAIKPGLLVREALSGWSAACTEGSGILQFMHPMKKESGREWKVFIQIQGANTFLNGPNTMHLSRGSMGILPSSATTQETWTPTPQRHYTHLFIGVYPGRISANIVDGNPPRIQTAVSLPFTQFPLFEQMMLFVSDLPETSPRHGRVIADILLNGVRISGPNAPSRLIQSALQLILDHPCNPELSVKWMAQQLSCHADYLSRRFHQETGTSFMAYVRSKRMEIAADLLRSHKMTVADVAVSCGYRDHSYFTRIFHQTYGVVPSQYSWQ